MADNRLRDGRHPSNRAGLETRAYLSDTFIYKHINILINSITILKMLSRSTGCSRLWPRSESVAIFAIAIRLSGVLNMAPNLRHGRVTPEKAVANPTASL